MAREDGYVSISDASVPNAGRIYDYLLGGNHNFEIDRKAAEQLTKDFPEISQNVRLIRWFLGTAVQRLCAEGFTRFVDFASGLPTVDHIHFIAPKGTKVVYSDIDPVTVSYGQEIVKDLPDVAFVLGDAGVPEKILQSDAVARIIGKERKIAFGFNGISWFLPDEKVAHTLQVLYDWAERGSKLFLSDAAQATDTEATSQVAEFYKRVNQPVFYRNEKRLKELFGKWKIADTGMQPLEKWVNIDPSFQQGGTLSQAGSLIGTILVKE